MEENGSKVSGIRQIVRLKELLHRWQSSTLSPKAAANNNNENDEPPPPPPPLYSTDQAHGGISPAICRRVKSTTSYCDSDEDGCQSPLDVPRGYLAVYVGPELQLRRFIIPTTYLTHPLFKVLLDKVEEEFGFDHSGGLTIPCEVETFKYLLKCMETHHNDNSNAAGTPLTIQE